MFTWLIQLQAAETRELDINSHEKYVPSVFHIPALPLTQSYLPTHKPFSSTTAQEPSL